MEPDYEPADVMDRDAKPNRYYRNAVERHWDPHEIDLERDRENFLDSPLATMDLEAMGVEGGNEAVFDEFRTAIAMFGAGEDAVTEDLAPLAVALEDIDDQLFITSQLYEEAKHADFFDRYWREVVWQFEDYQGWERSSPRDEKWFNEPYVEMFDRNRKAQHRLLDEDTPENRAKALCHYHLTVEGILAQTGYYGMQRSFGGEFDDLPHLPGLVEGFSNIRSDEGRHVGFGMHKLKQLIKKERVDPAIIDETVEELLPLVQGITSDDRFQPDDADEDAGLDDDELAEYALDKHAERMEQIKDAATDIPDVDDLVRLESDD
jgi:ribonucleoside-diphosphate reductase beta chain